MSDINLDFTVSNNSINFTVEPNDITITPTDIQLTLSTGGLAAPSAPLNSVQYNKDSEFAGDSTFSYIEDTETLGVQNLVLNGTAYINNANRLNVDVANLKITGGTNGYVLQTDGTGNLDWTAQTGGGGNGSPGGSNTQIQYNDNGTFGGNSGFTFNEISGNVEIPGSLSTTGNLTVTGNIIGTVANANYANYANYANFTNIANTANSVAVANVVGIGNIATVNLTGSTSNVLYGNGTFAPISGIASANFANYAGNVTVAAQPNITSLGNLTSLTLLSANIKLGNGSVALGTEDIAIGNTANANQASSGNPAIAIGESTYAVRGGIAIGQFAGKFVSNVAVNANSGIAIGLAAGYGNSRGPNSIAIGTSSGINSAVNSIAIGTQAGYNLGNNSIAIGAGASANAPTLIPSNSITLNATGSNLVPTNPSAFYVKPVRYASAANILYYDSTTGEITYQAGGNSTTPPAGTNTQVQFNNSNSFGASTNFTFNSATNALTVAGTISATGNVSGGNLTTSGVVTATGNITGGNIRTVNGYLESQNGNIYANGGYVIGGEGVFTNLRFVSNISSNASPSPVGISSATHKFPIVLNGTTYYILLSNT